MRAALGTRSQLGTMVVAVLLAVPSADGAVLCAKARKDGSFGSSLRIRESCTKREVEVDPAALGFCCGDQTTTTATVTSTSVCPTFTTTTLGIPDCQPGFCSPYGCANLRECVMGEDGLCSCSGPFMACTVVTVGNQCGGTCPDGLTCQTVQPVGEDGCPGAPRCGCAPDF